MAHKILEVFYDEMKTERVLLVDQGDGLVRLWHGNWCHPSDFQELQWLDGPAGIVCDSIETARREAKGNWPGIVLPED